MNSQSEINEILRRGYSVDIGGFINRGWEIFKENMGGFIGFFILVFLISIVLGIIPGVGSIASFIVNGPLQAGYLIVAFKICQGKPTEFGDFFKGFQNSYFLPTFLVVVVQSLIAIVCFLPAIIVAIVFSVIAGSASSISDGNPLAALGPIGGLFLILAFLIGLVAAIYIGICYSFALPFVVGKRMQFWPAMETSRRLISPQWFSFFAFVFVLGLINIAGALVCGLGLLITVPLTACALTAAYENIVGLPTFDPSQP